MEALTSADWDSLDRMMGMYARPEHLDATTLAQLADPAALTALVERAALERVRPGRGIRVGRDQDAHAMTIRRLRAALVTLRADPAADFFGLAMTVAALKNCCTHWLGQCRTTEWAILQVARACRARILAAA